MTSIRKDGLMTLFLVLIQLFAMRTMPFHSPLNASFAAVAFSAWIFGIGLRPALAGPQCLGFRNDLIW